jgi:hypothetical protein
LQYKQFAGQNSPILAEIYLNFRDESRATITAVPLIAIIVAKFTVKTQIDSIN